MGEIIRERTPALAKISAPEEGDDLIHSNAHYSAYSALAFEVGCDESLLRRLAGGKREWVEWDLADRIVDATVGVDQWFCEPLCNYYFDHAAVV